MAIRWNATTKKWVLSTSAVVGATLLILSLCKSCDAQDNAKEAKQTAVETKYKVDSVEVLVGSLEESTEQSLAGMRQDIQGLNGRVDNLTEELKEHSDSTYAQGVHRGRSTKTPTRTTTGTTTGTTEERVDTTSMSTVGVVTYGNVNVGDGTNIVVATGNAHVEQTVLPDDYVEVRVTYRETVVRDPKAWKKYARRCRGR